MTSPLVLKILGSDIILIAGIFICFLVRKSKQTILSIIASSTLLAALAQVYLNRAHPSAELYGRLLFNELTTLYRFIVLFFALCTLVVLQRHIRSFSIFLVSVWGLNILSASIDFVSFMIALELSLVPLVFSMPGVCEKTNLRSSECMLHQISGSILVWSGILVLYITTGSTRYHLSAQTLMLQSGTLFLAGITALLVVLVGTMMKTGIFPFHTWILHRIDTKTLLPSISLIIASALGSFFPLGRFLTLAPAALKQEWSGASYIPLMGLAITVHLAAVIHRNLERKIGLFFVAYNSTVLSGFIFSVHTIPKQGFPGGLAAAMSALIALILSAAGIMTVLLPSTKNALHPAVSQVSTSPTRMATHQVIVMICLLSLAGFPLTVGFFSRFFLLSPFMRFQLPGYMSSIFFVSLLASIISIQIITRWKEICPEVSYEYRHSHFILITLIIFLIVYLGLFPGFMTSHLNWASRITW